MLIFIIGTLFKHFGDSPKFMYTLAAVLSAFGIALMLYCNLWSFPADIDTENLTSAIENSYSLFGALLGMWVVYIVDSKVLKFETAATLWGQLLKIALGFPILLLILEGSKPILNVILPCPPVARVFRYFATVCFAGVIWPMTFKYFAKIGKKQD